MKKKTAKAGIGLKAKSRQTKQSRRNSMKKKAAAATGFQPQKILFPEGIRTTHRGENGSWYCSGLVLTYEKKVEPTPGNGNRSFPESIRITPLTSRGKEGRCCIEAPMSEIPMLTRTMNRIHRQYNAGQRGRK